MSALTSERVRVLLEDIKADVDAGGRVDLDVALDALQEVLDGLDAVTAEIEKWKGIACRIDDGMEAVLANAQAADAECDRLREFERFMRKQAADYGPSASLAASLAEWDGAVS